MCLLGKAPTIKSADGWWVSLVEDRHSENTRPQQPDSAEIVRLIDWNMQYIRCSHAIEALKNNQEKEIDSINSILQSIRTRHRKEQDSVYTVFFHNSALALPVRKDAVAWTQEERAALVQTVRKYIDERLNDSIPDHEKNTMADNIVSNWIQKTVGTKYPVVNSKMDPNRVLQDEVKEIFNNP